MKKIRVFILWHIHQNCEKLIGVYSSIQKARAAQRRASKLEGFRKSKKGFVIDKYIIDKDNWIEGFITIGKVK